MAQDQEWCHECGAARTTIREAPDWRLPLLFVGAITAAAVIVFLLAIANLGEDPATSTAASAGQRSRVSASVRGGPAPHRVGFRLASWAPGESGWTVALSSTSSEGSARALADALARNGLRVGLLDSSEHPLLRSGVWIVFAGHYPDRPAAELASRKLRSAGHTGTVLEVAAPGGI